MTFFRNKKITAGVFFFSLFLFLFASFVIAPDHAFAADCSTSGTCVDLYDTASAANPLTALVYAFNLLLYAVFAFVVWIISYAGGVLAYAVDPAAVKTLFEMPAVYVLWQMVRDFFNLFFILTLLFIAFATIFQISKYNYKALLQTLLLMALLVNFSWPISRFLVDATNVPMYFFLDSMFEKSSEASGENIAAVAFSSAKMSRLVLPTSTGAEFGAGMVHGDSDQTLPLLKAIVFLFIFGVTLLVLSILFVIRTTVLLVLVIFSSVGFAGLAIPGFQKYASKWWDSFLQYALFGPAAMLMILVAVGFMKEFAKDGSDSSAQIANAASRVAGDGALVAAITMIIPLVLMWMAMGVGQSMGIAGAGVVTKKAKDFSKWAGRKGSFGYGGYDAAAKRWKAYSAEREKRGNEKFAANNIGTKLAARFNTRLDKISASRTGQGSLLAPNRETAAARQARMRLLQNEKRKVDEKAKEYGVDANMTDDRLKLLHEKTARNEKDKTLLAVTSREVAKRKGTAGNVTVADMNAVTGQFKEMAGLRNMVAEDTRLEVAKSDPEVAYTDASGHLDEPRLREAVQKGTIDAGKVAASGMTANFLRLAATEGKLNEKLIAEYQKANPEVNMGELVGKAIDGTNTALAAHTSAGAPTDPTKLAEYERQTKKLEKSQQELHRSYVQQSGEFHSTIVGDDTQKMEVLKKADGDTLAKMADNKNPAVFENAAVLLARVAGPGKTAALLAKMSEDGKNIQGAVDTIKRSSAVGSVDYQKVQRVVDRMRGDYRFDGIV